MTSSVVLRGWIGAIALAVGMAACAPSEQLSIRDAEFRPPLGSSEVGAGYFTITSARADRIVAISSSVADAVEIHSSVTDGDMMSMRRLESVPLPAGKLVKFAPGGLHLMVFSPRLDEARAELPITIELESGLRKTVPFHVVGTGEGPQS
jgi:copper(I)-binding protein